MQQPSSQQTTKQRVAPPGWRGFFNVGGILGPARRSVPRTLCSKMTEGSSMPSGDDVG